MTERGDMIGHYEILSLIGRGGMGEVWLAHDIVLDRRVAIKFLPDAVQKDVRARERFLHEAKSAAALDHPFICKIFETGEDHGRTFIVMEYVEGRNLGEIMSAGLVPLRDALKLVAEIAEALEVAHARGIVHRDLKPANIVCTTQHHAKVMDFGIAKRILPDAAPVQATMTQMPATAQGMLVGTIDYMSPEQAKGLPVDGRSDIFSLGVILFELLAGKHPFSHPTAIETLSAVIKDPLPSIVLKPRTVAPELQQILKKCLAKDPAGRYDTVADFGAAVQRVRDEITGDSGYLKKRWPVLAALLLGATAAIFLVVRLVLPPQGVPPKAAPEPVSVLVVDFDNRTGDAVFNGAVEQALILGLEDAPFINIYKREDARRKAVQLDPAFDGKLDLKLGQLVCRSEGVAVLIEGAIVAGRSNDYSVTVRAVDPISSKTIAEREKTASKKAEVLNAVAAIAGPLCVALSGGSYEAKRQLSVETFTTSSLEAMNAYALAQELMKQGKRSEAIAEYEHAIRADPKFGRAYSGLAVVFQNAGEAKKAESYHQMALARIDSMNDREKFRTRGIWYLMAENYPKAIEEFGALVRQFPADSAGQSNLALAYFHVRDMTRAVEQGRLYTRIYPNNINGQFNLAWYAIGASDFALGLSQSQKVIALNPKFEKAYVCAALAELAQGRTAESATWYEKLRPIDFWASSLADIGLADLALYEGRLSEAASILDKSIAADMAHERPDLAAEKWIMLGQARLMQGQNAKAAEAAERALGLQNDLPTAFPAAEIFIEAGREKQAAAIAGDLGRRLEPEPRAHGKILEALLAAKAGRPNDAVAACIEAQKIADTWIGRLTLAKAYLQAKAFAEAHSELELCLKRRGEAASVFLNDLPSYRYFPQVYYYLGRAQEGLKSPKAKESYQVFINIKTKDEGDPLVKDARQRLSAKQIS
jgi:tetratricopeptide (TPR) repeat protein/tRNA A-37 threonylcarbamoyl transferase component Bud32